MIRTAVSFLALFGSLFVVSKALTQSQLQPKRASSSAATTENRVHESASDVDACCGDESALPAVAEPSALAIFSSDLVLLPASPESYLPAEERPGELLDSSISPVGLQELSGPRAAPERTPVVSPHALGGALFGSPEKDTHRETVDDDRPIGSGLREDLSDESDNSEENTGEQQEADEPLQDIGDDELDIQPIEDEANDSEQFDSDTDLSEEDETDAATERETDSDEQENENPDAEAPAEEANAEPEASVTAPEQPPLSPEMEALRQRVRDVLAYHIERPEAVEQRSPWGIMHALIAYGVDTEVTQGGRRINAIGWMCFNGPCRGQQLLWVENGRLRTRQGPGVQGHEGQFLAMLAQSKVKLDFPIRIDGQQFTVADLVEYEKRTCVEGTELTFKLIGLSHYLDSDAKWKTNSGQDWDLPKLIKEELKQPVIGAACGGTHRMMGFSFAVRKREKQERPMTGQWMRAKKYVDAYHDYTYQLQNTDGSFSTDWFRSPAAERSLDRRIETTGHILEWMAYSLPEDKLQDPRTLKAVHYLASLMWENREHDWEIGPKGHALHALAIYDERVFRGQPGQRRVQLAAHRDAQAAR